MDDIDDIDEWSTNFDDDLDDDTPIQLAINGVTIGDDATPAQAAAALAAFFSRKWCKALRRELERQAVIEEVARS